MSMSVRDYLVWTAPGSPMKYKDLLDPETQYESMGYMSINQAIWSLWIWKTGGESSHLLMKIGMLATSPNLALYASLGGAATIGLTAGIIAAEAGGFDRMVGITPAGDASIMQGVFNRWTRNL